MESMCDGGYELALMGVEEHVAQDRRMWKTFIAHPTSSKNNGKIQTLIKTKMMMMMIIKFMF